MPLNQQRPSENFYRRSPAQRGSAQDFSERTSNNVFVESPTALQDLWVGSLDRIFERVLASSLFRICRKHPLQDLLM